MNIHGLKQKKKEVGQELKIGKRDLGDIKYNKLMRKRSRLSDKIERLRKEKEVKKKKK